MYLSLITCIFIPFGMAQGGDAGLLVLLRGAIAYLAKMGLLATALAAFEVVIAKMRVFRVGEFLGAALMLGFLAALLLFVSRSM
jgi:formate hydrogenlyase subunit 4